MAKDVEQFFKCISAIWGGLLTVWLPVLSTKELGKTSASKYELAGIFIHPLTLDRAERCYWSQHVSEAHSSEADFSRLLLTSISPSRAPWFGPCLLAAPLGVYLSNFLAATPLRVSLYILTALMDWVLKAYITVYKNTKIKQKSK